MIIYCKDKLQNFMNLSFLLTTFVGYAWNTIKHTGTLSNILEHYQTSWNTTKHLGTLPNQTSYNINKHFRAISSILEHYQTFQNTIKHTETLSNNVEHYQTFCYTIKHSATTVKHSATLSNNIKKPTISINPLISQIVYLKTIEKRANFQLGNYD